MDYLSISEITEEFKRRITYEITKQDIQNEFRKLGYLNKRNFPTQKAIQGLDYREAHDIRGKLYYKWARYIIDEIGDILFEKYINRINKEQQ